MPVSRTVLQVLVLGLGVMSLVRADDSCHAQDDPDRCSMYTSKSGVKRCCRHTKCSPGQYAVVCKIDHCESSATCEPCPAGSYMADYTDSWRMDQCRKKRGCSPRKHLVVDDEGDSTRDRTCKCDMNRGYVYDNQNGNCVGPFSCPPGEELTEDGICLKCHFSRFKTYDGPGFCTLKRDCHGNYEYFSSHDVTRDNICLNITSPPEIPTTAALGVENNDELSTHHKAIIGGAVAGFVVIVCIILIVLVIRRRQRDYETDSDVSEKRRPEDWDSESGSDNYIGVGRNQPDNPQAQLLKKPKPHMRRAEMERLRVHIPPAGGQIPDGKAVTTPDSGIGDPAGDARKNSESTPTPRDNMVLPLQTQESYTSAGTIINVVGDGCKVVVGDQITHTKIGDEDKDEDEDDTDYEVRETVDT